MFIFVDNKFRAIIVILFARAVEDELSPEMDLVADDAFVECRWIANYVYGWKCP